MESGKVPISTRIDAILDYEVAKMSKRGIAAKYGVAKSTVHGWIKTRQYFVNKCLEVVKLSETGKFIYFLKEEVMEQTDKNPKDLEKQVKFLTQKVAYFEALFKECGINFDEVSKKNDLEQFKVQAQKKEEK